MSLLSVFADFLQIFLLSILLDSHNYLEHKQGQVNSLFWQIESMCFYFMLIANGLAMMSVFIFLKNCIIGGVTISTVK
jgi:hypothetical protein